MKKVASVKTLLLTFCAVGVLSAANQSWAADPIENCAQVTVTTETDKDSTPDNMVGNTVAEDDEACVSVALDIVYDFGDAPDDYLTTAGARQEVVPWLKLGTEIDDEPAGQPGVGASNDAPDEDGVTVNRITIGQQVPDLTASVVNDSGSDAYLYCWVDYNQNKVFDPEEFGTTAAAIPANTTPGTSQTVTVNMPDIILGTNPVDNSDISASLTTGSTSDSYARCRLSNTTMLATDSSTVVVDKSGVAGDLADGEVEDYPVDFDAAPVFDLALRKELGDGQTANVNVGDNVTFKITVINQGGVNATGINIIDYLPEGMSLATSETNWVATTDAQSKSALTLKTPFDLASGAADHVVTLTLTVDSGTAAGDIINTAEISTASGGTDQDSVPDNSNTETPVKDNEIGEDGLNKPGVDDEDDHDIVTITVDPQVDVELSKAVMEEDGTTPATNVRRGDTVIYVLTVSNKGPHDATDVKVGDLLPSAVTYESDNAASVNDSDSNPTSYDDGAGVWTIGKVVADPTGATIIQLRITATVN